MHVVLFVGFKDSGKDSAAQYLIENYNYRKFSFADALKDCLSAIFVWPREMLEGTTAESRTWREQVDPWWAERLGIPHFTPRYAMQYIGTNVFHTHVHKEVWVLSVEKRLLDLETASKVVFIDGRFPAELSLARKLKGTVLRIRRGLDPEWYDTARKANFGDPKALETMKESGIHVSEWAWIGQRVDAIIDNDDDLPALYKKVAKSALH